MRVFNVIVCLVSSYCQMMMPHCCVQIVSCAMCTHNTWFHLFLFSFSSSFVSLSFYNFAHFICFLFFSVSISFPFFLLSLNVMIINKIKCSHKCDAHKTCKAKPTHHIISNNICFSFSFFQWENELNIIPVYATVNVESSTSSNNNNNNNNEVHHYHSSHIRNSSIDFHSIHDIIFSSSLFVQNKLNISLVRFYSETCVSVTPHWQFNTMTRNIELEKLIVIVLFSESW